MADFVPPFDPTAQPSGYFNVSLANGGWMIITNESPCELALSSGSTLASVLVPAYVARCFRAPLNLTRINWTVLATFNASKAPISQVYGEAYAPDEWSGGEFYIPLARLTNVGNTVAAGIATEVQNDGNAGGATVLEATESSNSSGSNAFIDNQGNAFFAELVLGPTYQKLFQTIVGAAVGADAVILGANKANFTHVQNELKVDRQTSLDAGNIVTDGNGAVTISTALTSGGPVFKMQPTSAPVGTLGLFSGLVSGDAGPSRIALQLRADGYAQIALGNSATATWHWWASALGLLTDAAIAQVAGIATAGPTGVPIELGGTDDLNITTALLTTVLSVTTPNDGKNHDYMVTADLIVGAANTNNGVVTLQVAYTDPHQGALTLFYNVYGQNNLINGIAQAKGQGIRTDARFIRCNPNTTIVVSYQNSAAGPAKSDFSSAKCIMLG